MDQQLRRTNYPAEVLDPEKDDGTMPGNVAELSGAVVGHRIVRVGRHPAERGSKSSLRLTLDDGRQVWLIDCDDCCAYTDLRAFLLHADKVDHVITGVGTTDGFTTWHIYADMGDVLELSVDWSAGNPFYYGYGFDIRVKE